MGGQPDQGTDRSAHRLEGGGSLEGSDTVGSAIGGRRPSQRQALVHQPQDRHHGPNGNRGAVPVG